MGRLMRSPKTRLVVPERVVLKLLYDLWSHWMVCTRPCCFVFTDRPQRPASHYASAKKHAELSLYTCSLNRQKVIPFSLRPSES